MAQSLVKNVIHLVYSTKNRMAWIPEHVRPSLYAFQAGVFKTMESPAIIVGGVEDHVHALFSLSKNQKLTDVIGEVKKASSGWMKSEGTRYPGFYWQGGYAAFSVSESNVNQVRLYIENQHQHHRQMTFQDELRLLCQRHGIEIDERYVWD